MQRPSLISTRIAMCSAEGGDACGDRTELHPYGCFFSEMPGTPPPPLPCISKGSWEPPGQCFEGFQLHCSFQMFVAVTLPLLFISSLIVCTIKRIQHRTCNLQGRHRKANDHQTDETLDAHRPRSNPSRDSLASVGMRIGTHALIFNASFHAANAYRTN